MKTSKGNIEIITRPNYHRRIKSLRESKNFTQEYMAESLKISQRAYSSIENGQTQLTVERLYEIADILNSSLGEIINTEGNKIYNNNFNNNAENNKGNFVFNQESYDELKSLYERLIRAKDEEIGLLKELVKK